MAIEVSLLIDWLWPFARGSAPPADIRAEYTSLWQDVIARLTGDADHGDTSHPARRDHGIVLRDYHSPNLIWRSGEQGLARVGIIDFQDAVQGPFAYDLVSLLQDARLDVSADLERSLLDDYCAAVRASDANFDTRSFRLDYAALGAQRNSKILGIFARLAVRDHKPHYLVHMPRVRRYLERNLAHPDLAPLAAFHRRHLDDIGRG